MKRPRRTAPRRRAGADEQLAAVQPALSNHALARTLQRWASIGAYFAAKQKQSATYTCTIEAKHLFKGKRSFTVNSFQWQGPERGVGAGGVGRGGGSDKEEKRVEFSVVKDVDDLSHQLFRAAAEGFPLETLELTGPGGKFVMRFKDVLVTWVVPSGSGSHGWRPEDQVSFDGVFVSMTAVEPND